MIKTFFLNRALTRLALTLTVLAGLMLPAMADISAAHPLQAEVIVETPTLHPPLGPCQETYWYTVDNPVGYDAYLTLNALNPINSTNWAEWLPVLPEAGYYRVEAFVAAHDPITWCSDSAPTIADDTKDARYTIRYAFGETTVSRDQSPLSDTWLDLGEYFFQAGGGGGVVLSDLNGEKEFSTTVSFSAMRFTWTREPPHVNMLPAIPRNALSNPPPPWVDVLTAPAFDVCYLGTNSIPTMQAWWTSSPYRAVGVYLGGISYYEGCSIFTPDWVTQVRAMGWSFFPLWVGPQAPCSKWEHKMDDDPAVTYLQGRADAELAMQAARERGLMNYELGGTIIYYDLEAYSPADTACKTAVNSFLNGWTERLHELNNRSGIYGGDCSSYSTTWTTLENPPDDIWLAYWDGDGYDPNQSVYDMYCFPDTLYTNHQRIKQYAGEVKETWGGKSLTIDCDVADGEVAVPEIALQAEASTLPGSIQQAGWLSAARGWLVSAGGLYLTSDAGENWQRQPMAYVERAHLLPDGSGWAAGGGRLFRRAGWEGEWQSQQLPEVVNGWRVVQVGFNPQGEGWLVMQQPTSPAFSIGKLLRSSDGGQTWQVYELPLAEAIRWVDTKTAWMSGGVAGGELYRTSNGGKSWQAVPLPGDLSQASAPVWLGIPLISADGRIKLQAALGQAKTPTVKVYTSRDDGQSWQLTGRQDLQVTPSLPLPQAASGLYADGPQLFSPFHQALFTFDAPLVQLESGPSGLAWAVTRLGSCVGEKGTPGFACHSQDAFWLSLDDGATWRQVEGNFSG